MSGTKLWNTTKKTDVCSDDVHIEFSNELAWCEKVERMEKHFEQRLHGGTYVTNTKADKRMVLANWKMKSNYHLK